MSGTEGGDEAFASEMSGSASRPIGHAADDMTTEYSGWAIGESSRQPTATATHDVDYAIEYDAEYIPSGYNEDDDVSTSDYYGYSSEEWNDEFVDGRRNKKEQSQLQILADGYRTEYDNSADEEISPVDTDEEVGSINNISRGRRYDLGCPIEAITLKVGMTFESHAEFTSAVKSYSISNGFNIKFRRSGQRKVEVLCDRDCPWRIYASLDGRKEYFVVKTLNDIHTCSRAPRNRQANYQWIATHFLEKFRMDMNWKVPDMLREINEKFGITVSKQTCYKARFAARKMLQGTLNEHYHMMLAYVHELRKVNRGGTFELVVDKETPESLSRFKRLYICFDSLAHSFLVGCRPVIGLDGCFLKTETKGQLLSAVGRDGNNQMFPIAWAVVEGESQDSWTWFIKLLMQDLGIFDGLGWTVISDQQKVSNCHLQNNIIIQSLICLR